MNIPKDDFIKILNGDVSTISKYKKIVIPKKSCEFCGCEFIPFAKSNEVYCPECRNVSYDRKVLTRKDDVVADYRREYKRMYAHYMNGKLTKEEFELYMKGYKQKEYI